MCPTHDKRGMGDMLDCDAVMRQLWDYLDGELTEERMEAIRAHVAVCARCYPQYEFERTFLAALARARREHSDYDGLHSRVMSALRDEGLAA
ncbi:MAG: zf-HC2 domain-containing protein [Gemmatimonadaceae bacterium]